MYPGNHKINGVYSLVAECEFLTKARRLGWLQGKVKSPSSSASGGDSPVEVGPPNPINSGSAGESPVSNAETSSIPQQISQEKPQRPFSLKVK